MKKLISLVLSVLLVIITVVSSVIFANATENSASFNVGTAQCRAGDTVEIPIEIKNNPGITSFRIVAEYDTAILKLINVTFKDASQGFNTGTSQFYDSPYSISGFNAEVDINNNGQLAVLTFEIKQYAEAGKYEISLSYDEDDIFNMAGDNVSFAVNNGYVEVIPCQHAGGEWEYLEKETCTENGTLIRRCEICGDIYESKKVNATGHNFGNNNPTCLTCDVVNPNYIEPEKPTEPEKSTESEKPTQPEQPTVPTQPSNAQPTAPTQPITQPTTQPSSPASPSITKVSKPKSAKISKLAKGKKQFKASWKRVSGVTGYQIQYSTAKKFTKKTSKSVTVKGSKKTSTTVKKLKSKKKYYVRIRTYKNIKLNGKTVKVYSSWSKAKTVTTK